MDRAGERVLPSLANGMGNQMTESKTRERVDLLVVTPLQEEFEECLSHFTITENISTLDQIRFRATTPGTDLTIVLIQQHDMGKGDNISSVYNFLADFHPALLVCIGIAASLSKDMKIGEVCYTGEILDILDNSKVRNKNDGGLDIEFSSTRYKTPKSISVAMNLLLIDPATKPLYEAWRDDAEKVGLEFIPGRFPGRKGVVETIRRPCAKPGLIACGAVSATEIYNEKIVALDRRVLALETESGGIFSVADQKGIPVLTVRGICDYADDNKEAFEQATGGKARKLAVRNATTFLRLQLTNPRLRSAVSEINGTSDQLQLIPSQSEDLVVTAIGELQAEIDRKLRELTPGYSLQERDYRLPVPRVRQVEKPTGTSGGGRSEPSEIRDVLRSQRGLLISIPREYPDHSLPWIIASDILSRPLGNEQLVPVVVESERLQRPRFGVDHQMPESVKALAGLEFVKLIFIVDEFDFTSKTKTDFLVEEMARFPNASFIVIARDGVNILGDMKFVEDSGATKFRICDVSFSEMTLFIQKKYELARVEAEVVANRLTKTFQHFNLSAHPSYVAGIPSEVLTSLLEANRRAELIQLAVAGYLSFVVSGDKTRVRLSRTTREQFLTELVYAIKVERKSFDQSSLVKFAEDVANNYDYAIDPLKFISGFTENGILHFDGPSVQFTLPFMEAYLLAKCLVARPSEAHRYFDPAHPYFDMSAFSIYAELGPDKAVVSQLSASLDASIAELEAACGTEHVLLGKKVNPVLLRKNRKATELQKRIKEAASDIRANKDNTEEKQKLLDAANRVREETANRKAIQQDQLGEEHRQTRAWRALFSYATCTTLLGAGAERIPATDKRSLIERIVRLAALMLDDWTREAISLDFADVKSSVLANEGLIGEIAAGVTRGDAKAAKLLVEELVNLREFAYVAEPFTRIMYYLCETARERVLAESIANTSQEDKLERLVKALWLSDVDAKRGKAELLKIIKDLPTATFLRVVVSTHLAYRVFWSHSDYEDRLTLLDLADEALKRIGRATDRSEIKGILDATKKD